MSKVKYILVMTLAAAIVITGAFLPRLVSAAGDDVTLGHAGFDRIQSVEFELHRDIPSIGKLVMMTNLNSAVEISASKASMTEQQVREACRADLRPYIDAGLMADYREWQITTQAYLVQTGAVNGILWGVSILNDSEALYAIHAVIDDETGNLLRVYVDDQQFRGSELRTEYLYTLAELFFTGLGMSDYDYPAFKTNDLDDVQEGSNAVRYRFGDAVYGEVNVDLWVSEYGFYVDFPQMEVFAYDGK